MTKRTFTKAEQNKLAATVAIVVTVTLFMIFPASRGLIIDSATGSVNVNYVYDSFLAPVLRMVANAVTTTWSWLGGLLPW